MVNKRGEPVNYRPFQAKGAMAEGLLPVARELLNGDVERRLAQGWFRLAGLAGAYADNEVAAAYEKQGVADALAAAPGPVIVEGDSDGLLPLPENAVRPFKQEAVRREAANGKTKNTAVSGGTPRTGNVYKTADPVAKNMAPHQMALLNAIASGESGGQYNIRYTPQGGKLFDDLTKHPRVKEPTKAGQISTAAGRYQFTATTWDAMGGGDFSPENQDKRALQLAAQVYQRTTGRDLDKDLQAGGLTPQIIKALGSTWEAFKLNADRHIATYNESLARYNSGGETRKQEDVNSVAPPAIEPVVMRVAGGGGFKPLKGNSVAAQAYNASGTRTYLQQLNVAIAADVMAVYDKLGSDPAEFDKGLAALKKLHIEEHGVPDEIRADYEAAFARAALPFQNQARIEQKKRIDDRNKADFQERINVLETDRQKQLAVLTMDNDAAVSSLWQMQNILDDHYDAAVLHGLMSAEQAALRKQLSRREAAVAFYLKQAEGKTAGQIAAMREEMAADFGQGKLEHLDGDGWQAVENSLKQLEGGRAAQANKDKGEYVTRGQNLARRIELGYEIEADALAQFALDQNSVEDGENIYRQTMGRVDVARTIRDKPLREAVEYVRQMQADMGNTPTDEQIGLLGYAQNALKVKGEMLAQDPLSYGEAMRVIAPLDSVLRDMTPEGISSAIKERLAAGTQVAAHFGIAPRFFKEEEAAEIGKYVTENPESGAMIAGAMVEAAGGAAAALLSEFDDKAPQILQAGAILAMGGDPQAAIDVIYGSAANNEDGKNYQIIGPEKRQEWEAETLGSAADWLPDDMERLRHAAYAITKRRVYLQGIDVKQDDAAVREIYRHALQQAAGQVKLGGVEYGGIARVRFNGWWGEMTNVLVMPEIRTDRFEDVMAAIKMSDFTDAAIKPVQGDGKTPLPDGNFWRLYPVRWEGGYRFSDRPLGYGAIPRWIMGSDGKPFVYDPLEYKEKLAARVPGAFRP